MTRTEKNRRVPDAVLASVVLLLISVTIYVGGYVFLSDEWRPGPGPGPYPIRMRVFPNSQLAALYHPAAWVESRIRGYHIVSGDEQRLYMSSP